MFLTPAQSQIASDLHRFRVICCGRRGGKTTLAIEEIKGKALSKLSRIAYIAPCYDDETEILTNKGWVLFSKLDETELVASLNGNELIFEKPKNYFEYDYLGEMVGIDNANVDMLVTPHHRCLVKNHRKGEWIVKKAEEIEGTWVYKFKKDCDWKGKKYDKKWARFWGWYVSEGYARKRYKNGYEIIITQQHEKYFDDIRTTLQNCGLVFSEDKRVNGINFRIAKNKDLTERCLLLGKSRNKYVFDEILNADKEAIKEFLEAYWNGDGHYPKNNYDYKRAETNSKRLADNLQELIIKAGYSANTRKLNTRDLYSVSWLNGKFSTPLIRKDDYYRVNYSGKVYCVEVSSGIVMVRRKGKHYWSGNTYQQARDIAWELLKKELNPIILNINESRLELKVRTIKNEESLIVLRGWESIETLRGQAFDFIVIDEVAMMRNFWINWQEVIRPTLTDTKGEVMFISTPKGFNHFYDLYNLENTDKDFKSFHFTSYDNPYIPKEELETAKQQMTNDRFAQEYMADFRKTEGLVFKEFNREKHLFENEKILEYEKIAGIDFGYSNPAAIPFITIDVNKHYWITDEYYQIHKTEAEIADYAAIQKFQRVYPDPESPSAIEELRRRGVNIREVIKGKDSIISGIQQIRELFKNNRIHIHKKCLNLIYELETYSYPDKKDMHNESELPIDENNHLIDALRYALATQEASGMKEQFNIIKPQWVSWNKKR